MKWRTAILAGLTLLAASALPAAARQNAPLPKVPYVFQTNADEVLVNVSVLDKKGVAVDSLTQEQFSVTENGVPQKLLYFSHEDAPVSIGIVIDNSGSMREKRTQVDQAALNFVKVGNPGDEAFVVNFNDESFLDQEFTHDDDKLETALTQIESRGGTALYDAVLASLDYLNQNAKNDKKVLLVVSDGDDDASRYTIEQAVHAIQSATGPIIYAIGLIDDDDTRSMKSHAQRTLRAFTDATGGLAFFPSNLAQVDEITRQVAADIRAQYTLAYHSNQSGNGYRKLTVEIKAPHPKDYSIRTRAGYYLGDSGSGTPKP